MIINKKILQFNKNHDILPLKKFLGGFCMKRKRILHQFTKIVIDFMFYSGIVVCALVPFAIHKSTEYSALMQEIAWQMIAVLMISGTMSVYVLWEIRCIFKTFVNANPFTQKNVSILRRIAVASFVIAATYIYKCVFWFTLATAIIVIIFGIAGLFCLVLADVFEQAVVYKEENDLTV